MTEQERLRIAALLCQVSVQCRMGHVTLAQVDEQVNHVIWLINHPGWHNGAEANLMEATA